MSYTVDYNRINNFPSTKRASVNKLITENSVTRLINRLIDVDGYVITNGLSDVDYTQDIPIDAWSNNGADFEFVIHGYYFNISKSSDISGLAYLLNTTNFDFPSSEQTEHELKARIIIDNTDLEFPELYGQDDVEGKYQGIIFYIDTDEPELPDTSGNYIPYDFTLVKYMQKDDGTWSRCIPLTSLFKFMSISISDIDGGEISL